VSVHPEPGEQDGQRVLVILGPTAAGKTDLALQLAPLLDGEIISADSMMVYRDMDIGTAKPSPEERFRVAHHLVDIVDPDQEFDVAQFKQRAEKAIQQVAARDRLPMVVGGTPFYLRALLYDYPLDDVPPDLSLRRELRRRAREEGPEILHRVLKAEDPGAAGRIHPHDVKRVIRALEVRRSSGRSIIDRERVTPSEPCYDTLRLGLWMPRELLYRRIDRRVEAMVEQGLFEEVERLLARYGTLSATASRALGYRQVLQYLAGDLEREECLRRIKRDTRRFAKHQLTWFKREEDVEWIECGEHGREDTSDRPAAEALAAVEQWLKDVN